MTRAVRLSTYLLIALLAWGAGLRVAPSASAQIIADPAYYASVVEAQPEPTSFTLPVGSALHVVLQTPVSTAINHVGDPVEAAVSQPLYIGRTLVLGKQARLLGRVTVCEVPVQGENATLGIRFDRLTQDDGAQLPVVAHVQTDRPGHVWGGELTPGTKFRAIPYHVWGIGAYNRVVLDGPRQMGAHIQWLPGERMTLILESPLTLTPLSAD
ncbi:MAG: hypothetical protein IPK79_08860 [Vampirovibrionales bacterium]|nr:hypothetical protein [Vampirovibrionales bacterium]